MTNGTRRGIWFTAAFLGLAGCLLLGVMDSGGCGPIPELAVVKERAAEARVDLNEAKVAVESDLAAAEASGDAAAAAVARETLAAIAALEKRLEQAEEILARTTTSSGKIDPGGVVGVAAGALPPPWNAILMVGGPLLIGLIQEIRVRRENKAAVSIINGISAARAADVGLRASMTANKALLLKEYSPRARALVTKNTLATA